MLNKFLYLQIPLLIVILSVSCGTKRTIYTEDAEVLYSQAVEELEKEGGGFPWIFAGPDYDKVFELLTEIQLRHTFTPYATLAELRLADTYYKRGDYNQAAAEYENFIKTRPAHRELPHAIYYLAMSHYNEKKGADRDPTNARKALEYLMDYKRRFPRSDRIEDVNKRISRCEDVLAEREIYIGRFYMREKNYKAAYARFSNVLDKYPDSRYAERADKLARNAFDRISDQ